MEASDSRATSKPAVPEVTPAMVDRAARSWRGTMNCPFQTRILLMLEAALSVPEEEGGER